MTNATGAQPERSRVARSCPDRWLEKACPLLRSKRTWFGGIAHRGADRDEFQMLRFGAVLAPFQADTDDTVGAKRVGLGLHAGHGIPARPISRLGEHRQLGLLPDTGELVAHVVDRDAHHQVEWLETCPVQ